MLGDFRVLRCLGQGGMGQVYLAEQVALKRKVALKILRPELSASPEALQRFKREAEAVAQATHANIVQVYFFGEDNGIAFMALEYVEGRNLREFLTRKGPPDLLLALSIMRQVAAALHRAGELGIVHRDVKPENILLTRKGEVKVADFGLARCLAGDQPGLNITQSGVTMGTPLYMSPEQAEGKPLDPRSDIYSFGATCYHMLAGQPPFSGANAFDVALQHVRDEPPPLNRLRPDLPEPLCAVVRKMMAKDPAQRYQNARDLLRDVARLREGLSGQTGVLPAQTVVIDTVPAAGAAPAARLARLFTRQARHWALFAGSLVLAALVGVLVAWAERRRAGRQAADVAPADAGTVETLSRRSKKEETLRSSAELYLSGASTEHETGLGVCLELGGLYLDAHSLDDAEQLFARLAKVNGVPAYNALGHLGLGVVLALRNNPVESNREFAAAFPTQGGKPGAGRGSINLVMRDLRRNRRWRYWLTMARWYNKTNNGQDVPPPLRWMTPLELKPNGKR
jgi:serine/threonine-protein kinase